jgi:uncharacterized protein YebE (UPF0316 family)
MMIAERLNVGEVILRIIPKSDTTELSETLRNEGFGVTSVPASGKYGDVHVLFSVMKRKHMTRAIKLVQETNPQAFFTIEEVRKVSEGILPEEAHSPGLMPGFLKWNRK